MAKKTARSSTGPKILVDGEDGAMNEQGEILPILSKSAARLDYDRLVEETTEWKMGGSRFWVYVGMWLIRRTLRFQYRTMEISGRELVDHGKGALCIGWHTNGLLDPIHILNARKGRFTIGGRHDLILRRGIRFWARRFSLQPVIRQAELLRGGCSEVEARFINGRSLHRLADGISNGFGCALFPEGTSHSESHLIRFRTGPSRVILAAAELATCKNSPAPVIQPVGLHYRARHLYRTDVWIELGTPIEVPNGAYSTQSHSKLMNGEWVEPKQETVHKLRDVMKNTLVDFTPNAPDWTTARTWSIIAHIHALKSEKPLKSWREEVEGTRVVQSSLRNLDADDTQAGGSAATIVGCARRLAKSLHHHGLDGRDLRLSKNRESLVVRKTPIFQSIIYRPCAILLALTLLPLAFLASGIQTFLGFIGGNKTDEGEDARSTYQFLFGMIGSLLIWPIMSLIVEISWWSFTLFGVPPPPIIDGGVHFLVFSIFLHLLIFIVICWVATRFVFVGFDAWCDLRRSVWRRRFANNDSEILADSINWINNLDDVL